MAIAVCCECFVVANRQIVFAGLQTSHQSAAVFGVALTAMAEELGTDMAQRMLEHLLQYAEPPVRYISRMSLRVWPSICMLAGLPYADE